MDILYIEHHSQSINDAWSPLVSRKAFFDVKSCLFTSALTNRQWKIKELEIMILDAPEWVDKNETKQVIFYWDEFTLGLVVFEENCIWWIQRPTSTKQSLRLVVLLYLEQWRNFIFRGIVVAFGSNLNRAIFIHVWRLWHFTLWVIERKFREISFFSNEIGIGVNNYLTCANDLLRKKYRRPIDHIENYEHDGNDDQTEAFDSLRRLLFTSAN